MSLWVTEAVQTMVFPSATEQGRMSGDRQNNGGAHESVENASTVQIHVLTVERYREIYNSVLQPSARVQLSLCQDHAVRTPQ